MSLTCYKCQSQDKGVCESATEDCTSSQDRCMKVTVETSDGKRTYAKSCATSAGCKNSKATCSFYEKIFPHIDSCDVDCCPGDKCNGAIKFSFSSITMVVTLVATFVGIFH